ncbi:AMP-binding protein [Pantoea sp. FN0307]|uniref:AMP-binding protein n=1 Tax=Pantoea sp. FN0307 TaxID=3418560 RepID=UPI003CE99163
MQQVNDLKVNTKLNFLNVALTHTLTVSPHATALIDGESSLTYQQLYDNALRIAREFNDAGLVAGQRLALDSARSGELYLMVVACLLSGISFISVPNSMTSLQKYQFAAHTKCAAICSFSAELSELSSIKIREWHLWLIPMGEVHAQRHNDEVYCVRTSGTTGDPKLVPICVAQLSAFLLNIHHEITVTEGINWSWIHDLSFDFSIWEIFGALTHSGCLVVISEQAKRDPALALEILKQSHVHLLSTTPSEFRYLFSGQTPNLFDQLVLKTVVFCGEKLTAETLRPLLPKLVERQVRLINTYGPSEATVFCSSYTISIDDLSYNVIPIGKPFHDMNFSLQEKGEDGSGDLLLQGSQVFSGYEGRERLLDGHITGDICRCDRNGVWHYIGRKEGYYKINGFRVDPLEIEEFLQSVPGVCEAVVWLEEAGTAPSLIKACVNIMPGVNLTTRDLRIACAEMSPWLRPARYFITNQNEWPMNSRGKTDREEIKRKNYGL